MKNKKLSSVLAEQLASFIAWKSQQQSPKSNPVDPVVFALVRRSKNNFIN